MSDGAVVDIPPPAGSGGGGGGGNIAPGQAGRLAVYNAAGTGLVDSGSLPIPPGTSDKLPTYDATGKLIDSGISIADIVATASVIPPTPIAQNSFLVTGGAVVWIAAYNFRVSAADYYIDGTHYSSLEQQVSLAAAHATLDRIDVIAVNNASAVVVIPGVAAAQPSEPDIDPSTQVKLGVVLVTHATSAPVGASVTNLWLENAGSAGGEWDWTQTSGFTIGSSNSPRTGTKSIEGTNVAKNAYAQAALGAGVLVDPNTYDSLVLYIKSKAAWAANRALKVQWYQSGSPVGSGVNLASGTFGFDSAALANYQMVVIPIVQFAVPQGTPCNQLRLTSTNGAIGFFLDDISLQQGIPSDLQVNALTQAQADARYAQLPRIRKVGLSTDSTTGVKGAVQVDFAGTIIGWSIQADVSGSISVEVSKRAGSQTVPQVPDPVTHKISASAPIALASAQAKGVGPSGLTGWTTAVAQWDTIGFNVASITTITRATLWLRIQETP